MKRARIFWYWLLFILLSNIPPLHGLFRLFVEGILVEGTIDYMYVTRDEKFVYGGTLERAYKDPFYKRYKLMYPKADTTLCRVQQIKPWNF